MVVAVRESSEKHFLKANLLEHSMGRRGNCWDTQSTILSEYRADLTRVDVFDYIESLYNQTHRYNLLGEPSFQAFNVPHCEAWTFHRNRGKSTH